MHVKKIDKDDDLPDNSFNLVEEDSVDSPDSGIDVVGVFKKDGEFVSLRI